MAAVTWLVWAGLLLFVIGAVAKIVRYARMPIHVRWELYPVPHEKGRSKYGGSFHEELDWWTKDIPKSRTGELKAMGEEIFLLKGVHEHNRSLWLWSLPLHLGLYLIVVLAFLLGAGGVAERFMGTPLAGGAPLWRIVHHLTRLVAWIGLAAGGIGAAGLLGKRLIDPKLKGYTSPAALLNLAFLLAACAVGIAARATSDPACELLRARVGSLLSFQAGAGVPGLVSLELAMFGLFAAYMPFTFMSHMYMKFFTYHLVRWDDHPRRPGDPTDPRLVEALKFPVSWSAPHIQGDGKKTWADVVTADGLPTREGTDK